MAKKIEQLQKQAPPYVIQEVESDQTQEPQRPKTIWDRARQYAIPIALLVGFLFLSIQAEINIQRQLAVMRDQQAKAEQAAVAQREAVIISNYTNRMTEFLVNNNLMHATRLDEVRVHAQALTVSTLKQLGPDGKGNVIKFLRDTKLIDEDLHAIELRDVDLRGINLRGIYLLECYLLGADMRGADLRGANLSISILSFVNFEGANMEGVNLQSSDLGNAKFANADLTNAFMKNAFKADMNQLSQAKSLKGATMPDGTIHP